MAFVLYVAGFLVILFGGALIGASEYDLEFDVFMLALLWPLAIAILAPLLVAAMLVESAKGLARWRHGRKGEPA